ncbi:hypothetical protein ABK040_010638 [Willaertia magna]
MKSIKHEIGEVSNFTHDGVCFIKSKEEEYSKLDYLIAKYYACMKCVVETRKGLNVSLTMDDEENIEEDHSTIDEHDFKDFNQYEIQFLTAPFETQLEEIQNLENSIKSKKDKTKIYSKLFMEIDCKTNGTKFMIKNWLAIRKCFVEKRKIYPKDTKNYDSFYNSLQNFYKYIDGYCNIAVIKVPIHKNPWAIFGVLNFRGKDITFFDKLKIDFKEKCDPEDVVYCINKWNEMDQQIGDKGLSLLFNCLYCLFKEVITFKESEHAHVIINHYKFKGKILIDDYLHPLFIALVCSNDITKMQDYSFNTNVIDILLQYFIWPHYIRNIIFSNTFIEPSNLSVDQIITRFNEMKTKLEKEFKIKLKKEKSKKKLEKHDCLNEFISKKESLILLNKNLEEFLGDNFSTFKEKINHFNINLNETIYNFIDCTYEPQIMESKLTTTEVTKYSNLFVKHLESVNDKGDFTEKIISYFRVICIYVIYIINNSKKEIIYIGKTKNVKKRFINGHRATFLLLKEEYKNFTKYVDLYYIEKNNTSLLFESLNDEEFNNDLSNIEKYLINLFEPKGNKDTTKVDIHWKGENTVEIEDGIIADLFEDLT